MDKTLSYVNNSFHNTSSVDLKKKDNFLNQHSINKYNAMVDKNEVMETFKKLSSKFNHKGKNYLTKYLTDNEHKQKHRKLISYSETYNSNYLNLSKISQKAEQKQRYQTNKFLYEPEFSKINLVQDSRNNVAAISNLYSSKVSIFQ